MNFSTCDICDENESMLMDESLKILTSEFTSYGAKESFFGQVQTVKVYDDNLEIRNMLEKSGKGKVLIVDGGGSRNSALLGGNIASLANLNNWSGIIVNGCVRDIEELKSINIGILAIGVSPKKSFKVFGRQNTNLKINGTLIRPNEWIYRDINGILISKCEIKKN
tara:strand:- start:377 stop:874 length:498 start_codon:yes stop_codon:yes gene_type:complete